MDEHHREAVHRTILVVDVEGFGDRRRTNPHQVAVRAGMYRALRQACESAGISWAECRHEDRGDGLFLLAPAQIPKAPFVETMPRVLAELLREHNETHRTEERIRLRMALHAGEVTYDQYGVASTSINHTFRLIEAPVLKAALAESPGDLVVITSDWFFDEVVRHSLLTDPRTFRPVRCTIKETTAIGWMCRPDHPFPAGNVTEHQPIKDGQVIPRQLPPAPATFIGRERELDLLPAGPDTATMVISAIGGLGGVGKTWLALHWAHRAAGRFPDGQLFVDLNGFDPSVQPMPPEVAVRGFLDALGVDSTAIPVDLHAQAALYRSLVTDKRMLIVLDNARDAAQVTPLLPGSPSCTVLITSRDRMHSLTTTHGARTLALDMLSDHEARNLLARHLGVRRIHHDADAVTALLTSCAGLPLALGIVAGRAGAHPDFPLAALAAELREAQLETLEAGDNRANLAAVLSWSCAKLNPRQTRVFELLGQAPGHDLSVVAAANLTEATITDTRAVLRALERMSLVDEHVPGRYRMHDLVRLYAAQRSAIDQTALRRLADFYLQTADAGIALLFPHFRSVAPPPPAHDVVAHPLPDEAAASAWFDTEHQNLLAIQRAAVEEQWHAVVWHLARAVNNAFVRRAHIHDLTLVWERALESAEHLGAYFIGRAHRCLGLALVRSRGAAAALEHLHVSLGLFHEIEDVREQSYTHRDLAFLLVQNQDYPRALTHAMHARDLLRTLGEPTHEAEALNLAGMCQAHIGRHAEGAANSELALDIFRSQHFRDGEAAAFVNLGFIAYETARYADAVDYYAQALAILDEQGNMYGMPGALDSIGRAYAALDQPEQARSAWLRSLELYRGQGNADMAAQVRRQLEHLRDARGNA